MRELAVWILNLPNGDIVLQRRRKDANFSPGMLGFFGGHIDAGETNEEAAKRELGEETSLAAEDLAPRYLGKITIEEPDDPREFFVWEGDILDAGFEVYEGDGAEVYSVNEALQRSDTSPSTKQILHTLKEGK